MGQINIKEASDISNVCKGNSKTAYGFKWEYINDLTINKWFQ